MVDGERAAGGPAFVTRFAPRYLGALADFYRDIWDPAATPDGVAKARVAEAAHNLAAAGEEFPTYLFVQQERILGHLTTIPVRLRTGGTDRPAYWLIGFMVRPEHRNGPIGFLILKEAVRELELALSLTVQQTTVRLLTAVGFREIGVLPNYVRPLRPGRMLARLDLDTLGLAGMPSPLRAAVRLARLPVASAVAGLAARSGLGVWATLYGRPGGAFQGRGPAEVPAAGLDALWYGCRDALGCAGGRDSAYLKWRYDTSATGPYRIATVTEGATLRGIAVVRAPRSEGDLRLRGIRMATLSDLAYDPARAGVGLALLAQAERLARSLDADALLASTSHRTHGPLLQRRGFVRFGGNLHLLVRDATGALPGPTTLADWWVLRGDMNADNVF